MSVTGNEQWRESLAETSNRWKSVHHEDGPNENVWSFQLKIRFQYSLIEISINVIDRVAKVRRDQVSWTRFIPNESRSLRKVSVGSVNQLSTRGNLNSTDAMKSLPLSIAPGYKIIECVR